MRPYLVGMRSIGSKSPAEVPIAHGTLVAWRHTTLAQGLLGSLLMWAALPPLDFWMLAWVAPAPWLILIQRDRLPGERPYRALWLAGFVFWLLSIHWLRLPHPATHLGWIALSFYLAFYLPVFVALSRIAVHRFRFSIIVAAPVIWTGLELVRAHLLTGFLMAALGHTQYRWLALIQISDLAGAYAVSFVVMLVAAGLARMWPCHSGKRISYWPIVPSSMVLVAVILYGHLRMSDHATRPGPRVGIIQGSIAADWKKDLDKARRIFEEYFLLSQRAVQQAHGDLDLIVWPETMFRSTLISRERPSLQASANSPGIENVTPNDIAKLVRQLKTPVLLGIDTWHYLENQQIQRFNSAVMADRTGHIMGRYDKSHLVMFGEYVPLAQFFPWIYNLTPLGGGLTPGKDPCSFELEGIRYAPNICFETVLPHKIRSQLLTLADRGQSPDVLVNLTNDGWFWGSSELDMHLTCGVFRAVEARKPLLVAANTGLSAWITADGKIQQRCPRQQRKFIVADVQIDQRKSIYLRVGDAPAGLCLVACLLLAFLGWRGPERWP